ncbi:MAG: hypothetical protein ACLR8Y_07990 [Alistipes indistinctus]
MLIEDIEDIYIVSCPDPDLLVTLCTVARDRKREEIYRHALAAGKLSQASYRKHCTRKHTGQAAGTTSPAQKPPAPGRHRHLKRNRSRGAVRRAPPAAAWMERIPAKEPTQNHKRQTIWERRCSTSI